MSSLHVLLHWRPSVRTSLESRISALERPEGASKESATAAWLRGIAGDREASPEEIAEGMQLLEAHRRYMEELKGRSNGNPAKTTR
jgi:hypothetical protein